MSRRLVALAAIGLSLAACSTVERIPHPQWGSKTPPPPPYTGSRCGPGTACAPKEKSPHRQYFDLRHQRYYYYDPLTRKYFWEDGQPRL
jgi:hypothetical protein